MFLVSLISWTNWSQHSFNFDPDHYTIVYSNQEFAHYEYLVFAILVESAYFKEIGFIQKAD